MACLPAVAAHPDADPFWMQMATLLRDLPVVIDRPLGSRHPEHDWIVYPLDYGFIDGTIAADGDGIDVFLGSGDRGALSAAAITFDPYKRDVELKLLAGCTPREIRTISEFWDGTEMTHTFVLLPDAAASEMGGGLP